MRILYIDCFLGFDAGMLLSALIDAGANPAEISEALQQKGIAASIAVQTAERSSIVCKKATVSYEDTTSREKAESDEFVRKTIGDFGESEDTNAVCILATVAAIELLQIEYIITSEVSLAEGTDGRVIDIFNSAGIEIMPSDGSTKNMHPSDASLLSFLANESGPKPPMKILAIGYGAGGLSADEPNIVNAFIGETEGDNIFEAEDMELLIASL